MYLCPTISCHVDNYCIEKVKQYSAGGENKCTPVVSLECQGKVRQMTYIET